MTKRTYRGRASVSVTLEELLRLLQGEPGFTWQPNVRYPNAVALRGSYDARTNVVSLVIESPGEIPFQILEGQCPPEVDLQPAPRSAIQNGSLFWEELNGYLEAHPEKRAGLKFMAHTILSVTAALEGLGR